MKHWRFFLVCISATLILLSLLAWVQWGNTRQIVKLENISHEIGYSYIVEPSIPLHRVSFLGMPVRIHYKIPSGDSNIGPFRSSLQLFEDDLALGPAHSLHEDIRNIGHGKFSHWDRVLYFSASDNSDPRTNRRIYTVKTRRILTGGLKKTWRLLIIVFIVLGAMPLVGGLLDVFSFIKKIRFTRRALLLYGTGLISLLGLVLVLLEIYYRTSAVAT